MALKVNGTTITSVTYNGTTINELKLNNVTEWCRPFTLTISITNSSYVKSVTVTRTASREPSASTNVTISNGGTIYYGDTLRVTVIGTSSSVYFDDTYPKTITVTGNTTVKVVAHQKSIQDLVTEVAEFNFGDVAGTGTDELQFHYRVRNPNAFAVNCDIDLRWVEYLNGNTKTEIQAEKFTQTLNANGSIERSPDTYVRSGIGAIPRAVKNVSMKKTLSATGYTTVTYSQSFASPYYQAEETTTTTTTTPTRSINYAVVDKQGDWELVCEKENTDVE